MQSFHYLWSMDPLENIPETQSWIVKNIIASFSKLFGADMVNQASPCSQQ